MVECPKCKQGEIRPLSKQEKALDLVYDFLAEDVHLTGGDKYHRATILVCDTCGWFDSIADYGWETWYAEMKSILGAIKMQAKDATP